MSYVTSKYGGGIICDRCGAYVYRLHSGKMVLNLQVQRTVRNHGVPEERIVSSVLSSYSLCNNCLIECMELYRHWMKYKWQGDKEIPIEKPDNNGLKPINMNLQRKKRQEEEEKSPDKKRKGRRPNGYRELGID